jgi:hypothetical protein
MPVLILLVVLAVLVLLLARWANGRWEEVDNYYEREYKDPPIFDATDWLNGGRGF